MNRPRIIISHGSTLPRDPGPHFQCFAVLAGVTWSLYLAVQLGLLIYVFAIRLLDLDCISGVVQLILSLGLSFGGSKQNASPRDTFSSVFELAARLTKVIAFNSGAPTRDTGLAIHIEQISETTDGDMAIGPNLKDHSMRLWNRPPSHVLPSPVILNFIVADISRAEAKLT
ncbi:hypothetical protein FB451DRAFT_1172311 [Mycena latifolia]|nr:hypothetical protein FB451DRAFT_1172311 [Mycena latifolia]